MRKGVVVSVNKEYFEQVVKILNAVNRIQLVQRSQPFRHDYTNGYGYV